jgi:hypothetical protein
MLTAGFATITYLKSRLMPDAATEDTEWDVALGALGRGVAGKFDKHCARCFARDTAAVDKFTANGSGWVLTHFPVEAIDTVEVVDADGTSEVLANDSWTLDEKSGLLETFTIAGSRRQQLRITYAAGYWLDPRDGTAMPDGAIALPDDVLEAWVLQCQHEAESRGLFGAVSFRKQKDESAPKTVDVGMLEGVVEALRGYRRFGGE